VTALPSETKININTAPAEVLQSLNPKISAAQLVSTREGIKDGFTTTADFLKHPITAGLNIDAKKIDIKSQHFQILVKADFLQTTVYLRSKVRRDSKEKTIVLLNRSFERPFQHSFGKLEKT